MILLNNRLLFHLKQCYNYQFAVTQIVGFVILVPLMFFVEGDKFPLFLEMVENDSSLRFNLVMSGLCFYIYNELATYTLKVTGAVTASVANTAKRVVRYYMMCSLNGLILKYPHHLCACFPSI